MYIGYFLRNFLSFKITGILATASKSKMRNTDVRLIYKKNTGVELFIQLFFKYIHVFFFSSC